MGRFSTLCASFWLVIVECFELMLVLVVVIIIVIVVWLRSNVVVSCLRSDSLVLIMSVMVVVELVMCVLYCYIFDSCVSCLWLVMIMKFYGC